MTTDRACKQCGGLLQESDPEEAYGTATMWYEEHTAEQCLLVVRTDRDRLKAELVSIKELWEGAVQKAKEYKAQLAQLRERKTPTLPELEELLGELRISTTGILSKLQQDTSKLDSGEFEQIADEKQEAIRSLFRRCQPIDREKFKEAVAALETTCFHQGGSECLTTASREKYKAAYDAVCSAAGLEVPK